MFEQTTTTTCRKYIKLTKKERRSFLTSTSYSPVRLSTLLLLKKSAYLINSTTSTTNHTNEVSKIIRQVFVRILPRNILEMLTFVMSASIIKFQLISNFSLFFGACLINTRSVRLIVWLFFYIKFVFCSVRARDTTKWNKKQNLVEWTSPQERLKGNLV